MSSPSNQWSVEIGIGYTIGISMKAAGAVTFFELLE
jgi:hypothetical protein